MDQKFFQIQDQKLLCSEGDVFFLFHLFQIRIIHGRRKAVPGFGNDTAENAAFGIRKIKNLVFKKLHTWRIAGKEITTTRGAVLPVAFNV